MRSWRAPVVGLLLVAVLALVAARAAAARDGDVRVAGVCTGPGTSKLELSEEDGRIEVEFEVDQNRNGRTWTTVLHRNGVVVRRATRVTRPPSASFEFRAVVVNRPGNDRFVATGTTRGETCTARATWRR
jgi:hypothetical protein